MKKREDKVTKWLGGKTAPPKIIQVQPTNRCNLNCLFCDHRKVENELPDWKWIQIASEARKMGIKKMTITGGGEPLMRLELTIDMMKEFKKSHHTRGDMVTNGTLFTKDEIKDLISIKWDNITFSVHGANFSTDDYLRGKDGAFNETIKVVRLINRWKEKLESDRPKLSFLMVITKFNYNQIINMAKLSHKLKLGGICIKLVNENTTNPAKSMSMRKENIPVFKSNVEGTKKLANSWGIDFYMDFTAEDLEKLSGVKTDKTYRPPMQKNNNIYCVMPFCELVIFANGTVSPCCIFYSRGKDDPDSDVVDNISNKSLFEIWNGKIFNYLRQKMVIGHPPNRCLHCPPDINFRNKTWANYLGGSKISVENVKRYL